MIEANIPFCKQPAAYSMRVGHGALVICDVFPVSLRGKLGDVPQPRGGILWMLPARARVMQ